MIDTRFSSLLSMGLYDKFFDILLKEVYIEEVYKDVISEIDKIKSNGDKEVADLQQYEKKLSFSFFSYEDDSESSKLEMVISDEYPSPIKDHTDFAKWYREVFSDELVDLEI